MHLAVRDQRIDDAAGILDGNKALEPDASGLDVDIDDRNVTGIGERAGRVVKGALGKTRTEIFEAVRLMVGRARQYRDGYAPIRAGDARLTIFEHDVVARGLQQIAGNGEQFFAHLVRGQRCGAATDDE